MTEQPTAQADKPKSLLESLPAIIDGAATEILRLAVEKHQDGDIDAAESAYRQILDAQPDNAAVLHGLGLVALQRGLTGRAIKRFRQAVAIDNATSTFHNSLGYALSQRGEFDEAEEHFHRAMEIDPNNVEPFCNFAGMLARQARWDDAIDNYRRGLALAPDNLPAILGLGSLLIQLGRFEDAVESLGEGKKHHPDDAVLLNNLGSALSTIGRMDEALDVYRRLVDRYPDNPEGWCNLGATLRKYGRLDESDAAYHEGLGHNPDSPRLLDALAVTLVEASRIDEAMETYDRALKIAPGDAGIRSHYAIALLLTGDFENGWKEYEWRWKAPGFTSPIQNIPRPLWDGSPLEGRTILLHGEQGAGDTIQFARYAPLVAERGGRIILACQPGLERLMESIPAVDHVVSGGEISDIACHAPLMSLPRIFGTTLDTIPNQVPYLYADEGLSAAWAERIDGDGDLKVGLVWLGNPQHMVDHGRSLPAAALEPLTRIPGVRWFSLQKDRSGGDLPDGLTDLAPDLGDYADTAAAISHMDLVISVDTSVAHLAGAMGREVWILVPAAADWRWLRERDDSPWYPQARLFRRNRNETWEAVVERLVEALKTRIQ